MRLVVKHRDCEVRRGAAGREARRVAMPIYRSYVPDRGDFM